jgi:hypothetical protein
MASRIERVRGWLGTRPAKVVLAIVVVLVIARLALPHVIKRIVNDRLAHMEGYRGRVLDVDVSLIRGAYVLHDLLIEKTEHQTPVPFVNAPRIDISIEWAALLHGQVVAELVFDDPELNFVGGGNRQTGQGNDWRSVVDDVVPITINHLAIHRGQIHYHDFSSRPRVDLELGRLEVEATGLSTVRDESTPLPARLDATGRVQRSGDVDVTVRLDPWALRPTFDLDLSMESLDARELNPFLRAYAGVDAEAGRFFLYSELHSRDGRFEGYVKPMAEGLSLFRFGESGDLLDQLGDAIVQVFEEIFENHGTDRFGTRVPVSGTFENVETDGWAAIIGVLSNAFIRAITHGVEGPSSAWHAERASSPPRGG